MPACELVIFDCDGTLMDSELIAAEVETAALEPYGIKMSALEFTRKFAGTSSETVQSVIEEEIGRALPDDHIKQVKQKMNERLWREVKCVDGAHALLDNLDQPRCICSNAGLDKLKIELTRGELWDRFRPFVYSARDIEGVDRKPRPDIFLHAAKEFNVAAERVAVVEDSVAGIEGARRAGMRVIGFTGGSHTYRGHADVLTDAGAETVVSRLSEIPAVVAAFEHWAIEDSV
ncbi:MAG: HAD family phosphatase [Pseudomonadota bacterium]